MTKSALAAVAVLSIASGAFAAPPAPPAARPRPGAPPRVLTVVRQTLKHGTAPAYQSVEAAIARGYERAKIPLYWLALQSTKTPTEILYLNFHDTVGDADRAAAIYRDTVPRHADLLKLQQRLAEYRAAEPKTTLTTRRDEFVYGRTDVDFTTMAAVQLTVFHVAAGHEGEFVDAATTGRASPWLLYEATNESTFVIVAPLKSTADAKTVTLPRRLRRLRHLGTIEKPQTFVVRASMSHLPPDFLAAARARKKTRAPAH